MTTSELAERLLGAPERRGVSTSEFEVRDEGDDLVLTGYASVFNKAYTVAGGPEYGGWNETVDPSAFKRTLGQSPDVHLLINHGGLPLARTKSGTLTLSTDSTGLITEARLDRADPDVQRLRVKMKRGDLDEMSFAFRTVRQEWDEDYNNRTLTELDLHKGDVSVVNFGANPNTSATIRGLSEALEVLTHTEPEKVGAELRSLADPTSTLRDAQDMIRRLLAVTDPRQRRSLSVIEAERLTEV